MSDSVETQLAVISIKLDVLIEQRGDHETRLRSLEKYKWVMAGFCLAGGGASGAVMSRLIS